MIALIPLTRILRKSKVGYEFSKVKEKVNHLPFMDDLKLYAKNEKSLDSLIQTVRIFSKDIGVEFGIGNAIFETRKYCYIRSNYINRQVLNYVNEEWGKLQIFRNSSRRSHKAQRNKR